MLKVKDLREKTLEELGEELSSLQKELLQHRLAFHARNLENTCAMRNVKKSISRVLTIIGQKKVEEKGSKDA